MLLASSLLSELAKVFFVGFGEVGLEVGHCPVSLGLVAPLLGSSGEKYQCSIRQQGGLGKGQKLQ